MTGRRCDSLGCACGVSSLARPSRSAAGRREADRPRLRRPSRTRPARGSPLARGSGGGGGRRTWRRGRRPSRSRERTADSRARGSSPRSRRGSSACVRRRDGSIGASFRDDHTERPFDVNSRRPAVPRARSDRLLDSPSLFARADACTGHERPDEETSAVAQAAYDGPEQTAQSAKVDAQPAHRPPPPRRLGRVPAPGEPCPDLRPPVLGAHPRRPDAGGPQGAAGRGARVPRARPRHHPRRHPDRRRPR